MTIHSEAELHRKYVAFAKLLNIYLNHFPKHEKYALSQRIRDTAYEVYDLITEAQKRYHKKSTLTNLDIRHQQLRMQLNLANELEYYQFKDGRRYPDNPAEVAAKRYLNFVGFRTWQSKKFIRKHSLYKFKTSVKKGKLESCISILGHAKQTASLNHLLTYAKETSNDLYRSLPQTYHRLHHHRAAPAGE